MPRLMLDTNVCVHLSRSQSDAMYRRVKETRVGEIAISSVVAAELWLGVAKNPGHGRNLDALRTLLDLVPVLDWPGEAARIYGKLRATLEAEGRVIGAMDMLIAAHALH